MYVTGLNGGAGSGWRDLQYPTKVEVPITVNSVKAVNLDTALPHSFLGYVISVDVTDRLPLPRNWFIAMFDYRDRKIYKNGLEHNLRAVLK
jgi:hypothetical protein